MKTPPPGCPHRDPLHRILLQRHRSRQRGHCLVAPNLLPDRRTDEDYAIVSRVFHPDIHAMLVELAGFPTTPKVVATHFW